MDGRARGLTRLDRVTLALAWAACLPIVVIWADDLDVAFPGAMSVVLFDLALVLGTAGIAQHLLGSGSPLRWLAGAVPRRYHAVLLTWFACVVTSPVLACVEGVRTGRGLPSGWAPWGIGTAAEPTFPALSEALDRVSVGARLLGPVVLLVMFRVDSARWRRAWRASQSPVAPLVVPPRWSLPSVPDGLALLAVWAAPAAGLGAKATHAGVGTLLLLVVSPLLVVGAVHGIWVFTSVLGPRSRVRASCGRVPRRDRVAAGCWALAVVVPGVVFSEPGIESHDEPSAWAPTSALESLLGAAVPWPVVLVLLLAAPSVAVTLQVRTHVRRNRDRAVLPVVAPGPSAQSV